MIANIAGGGFMWAVHFLARSTGPKEYGIFMALLAVAMCIPVMPLQMMLTQQTAKALATEKTGELNGLLRALWIGLTVLWLIVAVLAVVFHRAILEKWDISNPMALWLTLPVVLFSLWAPLFAGVLQGQQNFLWLGWSMLANAIGRFGLAAICVLALAGGATGMVTGVLLGMAVALGIGMWHTRGIWLGPALPFDWKSMLRQVLPLMLGFGAFQFLFTADTMYAKSYFDSETVGFYGSAGTLSRALMWLVGPLATVMFPRIVHSAAREEKSNLMGMVLLGTGLLSIVGAVGLSLVGPLVVKIVYGAAYVKVASAVLPWYAFAMVPLSLANVLLNNLLARGSYKLVPALCVLAVVYAAALTRFHATPVMLLQTLGVCNLLLLAICAWFTWVTPARRPQEQ